MVRKIFFLSIFLNFCLFNVFAAEERSVEPPIPNSAYMEKMNKALKEGESIEKAQMEIMNISSKLGSSDVSCKECNSASDCDRKLGLNISDDTWQYKVICYGSNNFCVQATRKSDSKKISINKGQNPKDTECR
ncbi:MAG: hypothetical protein PHT53_01890 [Candidatus Omnitrophica bacterium]|nr:hypothetical protein [Candidatus Omnitrophota bacterium]